MKLTNVKTNRSYTVLSSKGNVVAAWCSHVKPVIIKIDGAPVKVYSKPESDYIYFRYQGSEERFKGQVEDRARCVWAKDKAQYDFLKEKSLKVTAYSRGVKAEVTSAAKAGVRAKATKPEVKAPRPIKVIKAADVQVEARA